MQNPNVIRTPTGQAYGAMGAITGPRADELDGNMLREITAGVINGTVSTAALAANIATLGAVPEIGQKAEEVRAFINNNVGTPRLRNALRKVYFTLDTNQAAWADPTAVLNTMAELIAPVGAIGAGAKLAGKGLARIAPDGGRLATAAAADPARTGATALAGGMTASDVSMTAQESVRAAGGDDTQQRLAGMAGLGVGAGVGALTGPVVGEFASQALQRMPSMPGGRAAKAIGGAKKGAVAEGLEEGAVSVAGQATAVPFGGEFNTTQAIESALAGAVGGAGLGAGTAAIGPAEQAAIRARAGVAETLTMRPPDPKIETRPPVAQPPAPQAAPAGADAPATGEPVPPRWQELRRNRQAVTDQRKEIEEAGKLRQERQKLERARFEAARNMLREQTERTPAVQTRRRQQAEDRQRSEDQALANASQQNLPLPVPLQLREVIQRLRTGSSSGVRDAAQEPDAPKTDAKPEASNEIAAEEAGQRSFLRPGKTTAQIKPLAGTPAAEMARTRRAQRLAAQKKSEQQQGETGIAPEAAPIAEPDAAAQVVQPKPSEADTQPNEAEPVSDTSKPDVAQGKPKVTRVKSGKFRGLTPAQRTELQAEEKKAGKKLDRQDIVRRVDDIPSGFLTSQDALNRAGEQITLPPPAERTQRAAFTPKADAKKLLRLPKREKGVNSLTRSAGNPTIDVAVDPEKSSVSVTSTSPVDTFRTRMKREPTAQEYRNFLNTGAFSGAPVGRQRGFGRKPAPPTKRRLEDVEKALRQSSDNPQGRLRDIGSVLMRIGNAADVPALAGVGRALRNKPGDGVKATEAFQALEEAREALAERLGRDPLDGTTGKGDDAMRQLKALADFIEKDQPSIYGAKKGAARRAQVEEVANDWGVPTKGRKTEAITADINKLATLLSDGPVADGVKPVRVLPDGGEVFQLRSGNQTVTMVRKGKTLTPVRNQPEPETRQDRDNAEQIERIEQRVQAARRAKYRMNPVQNKLKELADQINNDANTPEGALPVVRVNDLMQLVRMNTSGLPHRIAKKLEKLDLNTPVFLVDADQMEAFGHYDKAGMLVVNRSNPMQAEIFLDITQPDVAMVALHEAVHAATYLAIKADKAGDLEPLRQQIASRLGDDYRSSNIDELVANAFTDPAFQQQLMDGSRNSLWARFVNWVRDKILPFTPRIQFNELDRIMNLSSNLFLSSREQAELAKTMGPDVQGVQVMGTKLGETLRGLHNPDRLDAMWNGVQDFAAQDGRYKLFKTRLGLSTLRQLGEWGAKFFRGDEARQDFRQYIRMQFERDGRAKDLQLEGDKLSQQWNAWQNNSDEGAAMSTYIGEDGNPMTQAALLDHTMLMATMRQYDPSTYDKSEPAHDEVEDMYDALTSQGKQWFDKIRDYYRRDWEQTSNLLRTNLLEAAGYPGVKPEDVATQKGLDKFVDEQTISKYASDQRKKVENETLRDLYENLREINNRDRQPVYFPLRRMGNWVIEGRSNEQKVEMTADQWRDMQAEDIAWRMKDVSTWVDDTSGEETIAGTAYKHVVQFFDTKRGAEAFRREIQGDYPKMGPAKPRRNYEFDAGTSPGRLLNRLKTRMGQDTPEFKRLEHALVSMMPQGSVAHASLHRKNIKGASSDMRQSFAQHVRAMSHWRAQAEYGDKVQALFNKLDKHAKEDLSDETGTEAAMIVETLRERDKLNAIYTRPPPAARALTDIAFVWYLLSPSYWMINGLQPFIVGMPVMAAKYGWANTMRAMKQAYTDGTGRSYGTGFSELMGLKGLTDPESQNRVMGVAQEIVDNIPDKGSRDMLQDLSTEGLIDLTFAIDLRETADWGATGSSMGHKAMQKMTDLARAMPHLVEVSNRTTTALATYRMAKDAGLSHDQAVVEAKRIVAQTQGDYSAGNKALWMQTGGPLGEWASPILLFKQYAQFLYYLIGRNLIAAWGGNVENEGSKVGQREGALAFAGLLGSHAAVAGVMGSVFMEPVKIMLGALLMAYNEFEEDEPISSVEELVRRGINSIFGDEVGEVVAKGLPRAFGIDLSSRTGLDSMLLMYEPYSGADNEENWKDFFIALGGPVVALGLNGATGASDVLDGNYRVGLRKLFPKFGRDFMDAGYYQTTGLLNSNGDVILTSDDMSVWSVMVKAAGFGTAQTSEVYDRMATIRDYQNHYQTRRTDILKQMEQADYEGDPVTLRHLEMERDDFNAAVERNGLEDMAITPRRERTSRRERRRNREERLDQTGLTLPRTEQGLLELGDFYQTR